MLILKLKTGKTKEPNIKHLITRTVMSVSSVFFISGELVQMVNQLFWMCSYICLEITAAALVLKLSLRKIKNRVTIWRDWRWGGEGEACYYQQRSKAEWVISLFATFLGRWHLWNQEKCSKWGSFMTQIRPVYQIRAKITWTSIQKNSFINK